MIHLTKKGGLFMLNVVLVLLLLPSVLAVDEDLIYKANEPVDIKVPCYNQTGSPCDGGTKCNITIQDPEGHFVVSNNLMTSTNSVYNYSLHTNETSKPGDYNVWVNCIGDDTGFTSFTYKVTPSGKEPNVGTAVLYIGLILVIVTLLVMCIYMFSQVNKEAPHLRLLWGGFAYLFFWSLTFIMYMTASDFLIDTFIIGFFWILYLFFTYSMFPAFFCIIVWYFYQLYKLKQIQQMIKSGVPEDQAYERLVKGTRRKYL